MQFLTSLWNAELLVVGREMLTFLVFLIMFMLMGRFRLAFCTSLFAIFYFIFINNRGLIDSSFSIQAATGMFIGSGAIFLGLMVWSFFIDSD